MIEKKLAEKYKVVVAEFMKKDNIYQTSFANTDRTFFFTIPDYGDKTSDLLSELNRHFAKEVLWYITSDISFMTSKNSTVLMFTYTSCPTDLQRSVMQSVPFKIAKVDEKLLRNICASGMSTINSIYAKCSRNVYIVNDLADIESIPQLTKELDWTRTFKLKESSSEVLTNFVSSAIKEFEHILDSMETTYVLYTKPTVEHHITDNLVTIHVRVNIQGTDVSSSNRKKYNDVYHTGIDDSIQITTGNRVLPHYSHSDTAADFGITEKDMVIPKEFVEPYSPVASTPADRTVTISVDHKDCLPIAGDLDKIRQVFLNAMKSAAQPCTCDKCSGREHTYDDKE